MHGQYIGANGDRRDNYKLTHGGICLHNRSSCSSVDLGLCYLLEHFKITFNAQWKSSYLKRCVPERRETTKLSMKPSPPWRRSVNSSLFAPSSNTWFVCNLRTEHTEFDAPIHNYSKFRIPTPNTPVSSLRVAVPSPRRGACTATRRRAFLDLFLY